MFYLTRQERLTLLAIGALILLASALRYLNLPFFGEKTHELKLSSSPASGAEILNIDLNKAFSRELQEIPGIGPVTAGRIIEYRSQFGPFKDIEDLKKVKGIGEKKLLTIKDYISIY